MVIKTLISPRTVISIGIGASLVFSPLRKRWVALYDWWINSEDIDILYLS